MYYILYSQNALNTCNAFHMLKFHNERFIIKKSKNLEKQGQLLTVTDNRLHSCYSMYNPSSLARNFTLPLSFESNKLENISERIKITIPPLYFRNPDPFNDSHALSDSTCSLCLLVSMPWMPSTAIKNHVWCKR